MCNCKHCAPGSESSRQTSYPPHQGKASRATRAKTAQPTSPSGDLWAEEVKFSVARCCLSLVDLGSAGSVIRCKNISVEEPRCDSSSETNGTAALRETHHHPVRVVVIIILSSESSSSSSLSSAHHDL